jgi:hypothetical protein
MDNGSEEVAHDAAESHFSKFTPVPRIMGRWGGAHVCTWPKVRIHAPQVGHAPPPVASGDLHKVHGPWLPPGHRQVVSLRVEGAQQPDPHWNRPVPGGPPLGSILRRPRINIFSTFPLPPPGESNKGWPRKDIGQRTVNQNDGRRQHGMGQREGGCRVPLWGGSMLVDSGAAGSGAGARFGDIDMPTWAGLAYECNADGTETKHAREMRAEDEGWKLTRPAMLEQLLSSSWDNHEAQLYLRNVSLQVVQRRVCNSWCHHRCSTPEVPYFNDTILTQLEDPPERQTVVYKEARELALPGEASGLSLKSLTTVTYMSATCRHDIKVPIWHCKDCGLFSASPVRAGCWPSRYLNGETWVDLGLLQTFERHGPRHGQAVSGVLNGAPQVCGYGAAKSMG